MEPQVESPVPYLLSSNNVATDQERKTIRSFIQTLDNRRREIDKEIEALIKVKQEEKAAIDNVIREHEAIIHPARNLAPEVLGEIFRHCQRGRAAGIVPEIPYSFHPLEGPILLTHVCRQWRTVALACSNLWTTLRIDLGSVAVPSQSQLQSQLSLTNLWIHRSRISPLDICFRLDETVQPVVMNHSAVFEALLECSNRWRSVYTISLLPHSVLIGLAPYANQLSAAKMYKLVSPDIIQSGPRRLAHKPYSVQVPPDLIVWPLDARNISFQCPFFYGGFFLPLGQLTTLEIYSEIETTFITIEEFFSILAEGPNLEDLRVRCIGIHTEFPDPESGDTNNLVDFSHERLRSLQVAVVNEGYIIDPLLKHAVFPSLRRLAIGSTTHKRPWTHNALFVFLDCTAGSIEDLEIVGRGLCWSEIVQYLARTPNAARLSVTAHGLGDYQLNFAANILPRLEHLRLEGEIYLSSGAFAEFLRKRCGRGVERDEALATLRSLDIRCLAQATEFVDVTVFEKLKTYWESGTRIRIETDYARLFPRETFLPRRSR